MNTNNDLDELDVTKLRVSELMRAIALHEAFNMHVTALAHKPLDATKMKLAKSERFSGRCQVELDRRFPR